MGELGDRRARKKARTREEIRTAAQELFAQRGFDAVTIADIAARADVAVQTVFNHFPTKEELFFADRTPWVDGPAEAVRSRADGVLPLTALRSYTMDVVRGSIAGISTAERQQFIGLVLASPALQAFELELARRTETRLAAALVEAWTPPAAGQEPGAPCRKVRMAASLTAALWVSAASSVMLELRDVVEEGADPVEIATAVETVAERVFERLEGSLETLLQVPGLQASSPIRRAG